MAPPRTKTAARVSVTAVAFAELCLALTEGEFTRTQLVARLGIHDSTLGKWLKMLNTRKLVYICEWRRNHTVGALSAVWTWGYKEHNVAKPPGKSQRVHTQKHLENKLIGVFYDIARTSR